MVTVREVGGPFAYGLTEARREDIGGAASIATFRFAWHESLHARMGIAVLGAGTAVFVAGCVLLARPFVKRRRTLLITVPLAGVAGVAGARVAGAAAIVICQIVLAFEDFGGGGGVEIRLPDCPKRRERRQTVV